MHRTTDRSAKQHLAAQVDQNGNLCDELVSDASQTTLREANDRGYDWCRRRKPEPW